MQQDAPAGAATGRPHTDQPAPPEPHRRAWLRLGHAPGLPPGLRVALRRHMPDTHALGAALQALIDGDDALVAPRGPLSREAAARLRGSGARRAVEAALEWEAGAPDRHLITLGACGRVGTDGPRYPESVACLDSAPPVLALRGDPAALDRPGLAIVGSRRATPRGLGAAREHGEAFARRGVSIVSGLAYGIDAAAHVAALDAGGVTIAVVATGPDRVYPARHAGLAARIAASGGAVVSEHPCRFELRPYHFPYRNRLVAALSLGTLIVEAAEKSGTLGTAEHANAQSRAVMALPGPSGDPAYAGCHRLVREGGARLVTGPDDVAAVLAEHMRLLLDDDAREREIRRRLERRASARAVAAAAVHAPLMAGLAHAPRRESGAREGAGPGPDDMGEGALAVHAALGAAGLDAGALAAGTGLGIGAVAAALARLEAAGFAARDGAGGYVRCRPQPDRVRMRDSTPRPVST